MLNTNPELVTQLHADRAARLRPTRTSRRRAHLDLPALAVWQVLKPRRAAQLVPDLQPCG